MLFQPSLWEVKGFHCGISAVIFSFQDIPAGEYCETNTNNLVRATCECSMLLLFIYLRWNKNSLCNENLNINSIFGMSNVLNGHAAT